MKIMNVMNPKILLLSLFISFSAFAEIDRDDLSVSGFVSQGFIYSPQVDYGGENSRQGSFNFREAGLNVLWQANNRLNINGQIVYRELLEEDEQGERLDFLFADYKVLAKPSVIAGLRFGRFKNPIGLYNSVRDIPNARPGIMLPNIYFNSLRDLTLSSDGLELYGNFLIGSSNLDISLYKGQRDLDDPTLKKYTYQSPNTVGDFNIGNNKGVSIQLRPNTDVNFILGYSAIKTDTKLDNTRSVTTPLVLNPSLDNDDYIVDSKINYNRHIWSMQYGVDDWLFTYEKIHLETTAKNTYAVLVPPTFDPLILKFDIESPIVGSFIQAEYFFDNFNLLARYEEVDLDGDDFDTSGLTIAAKWLIDKNLTLAAEISNNHGVVWVPDYEGLNVDDIDVNNWKSYILQLTYQF